MSLGIRIIGLGGRVVTKSISLCILRHTKYLITVTMRSCEECRRRRIKCEVASNGSEPCPSCKGLHLVCITDITGSVQDYTGRGSPFHSDEPVECNFSNLLNPTIS